MIFFWWIYRKTKHLIQLKKIWIRKVHVWQWHIWFWKQIVLTCIFLSLESCSIIASIMSRMCLYLSEHETESYLINCISETVYVTLITDVLSIKYACQHKCSAHEGRHNRTIYETWIRKFCSDPNELSAPPLAWWLIRSPRRYGRIPQYWYQYCCYSSTSMITGVLQFETRQQFSSLQYSIDNSLHDRSAPSDHINLMSDIDGNGLISRALIVHASRRRNQQTPSMYSWALLPMLLELPSKVLVLFFPDTVLSLAQEILLRHRRQSPQSHTSVRSLLWRSTFHHNRTPAICISCHLQCAWYFPCQRPWPISQTNTQRP